VLGSLFVFMFGSLFGFEVRLRGSASRFGVEVRLRGSASRFGVGVRPRGSASGFEMIRGFRLRAEGAGGYTSFMRSRSATAIDERRAARMAAMTPAARVALAVRLGEEGLATFMAANGLDRGAALARIKATRRLGRRPSRSADADGH
jgi:hypothetical protein